MESDDQDEDLEEQSDEAASECEDESEAEEEEQVSDEEGIQDDVVEGDDMGCVKVIPMGLANKSASFKPRRKLHALILTPTRELAIQVKNHLVAVSKYCDIKVSYILKICPGLNLIFYCDV
jgi:ATP-dependent RNA helicase DDX24/MAK5